MNPVLEGVVRNADCRACKLWTQADGEDRCVTGVGIDISPRVVVVTKFPMPDGGKAKNELLTYLREAGVRTKNIMWLSALKCRTWDLDPGKTDQKACKPYLEAELNFLQPKYVLAVGGEALFATTGKVKITEYRGKPITMGNWVVLPTISPAMVNRNPGFLAGFKSELKYFATMVSGKAAVLPPHHVPAADDVTYVDSKAGLRSLVEALQGATACSYDIETNGASEHESGSRIVSIAFTISASGEGMDDATVWQLPLWHPESPWRGQWQKVLKLVGRRLVKVPKLIAHNAKFDSRWLRHFGVPITPTFDTIMAAAILDENRVKGLKPLAQMLLGADPWGIDTKNLVDTPIREVMEYNGLDTWHTLRLYYLFRKHLKKEPRKGRFFMAVLMPAIQELIDVERRGVYVDRQVFTDNWDVVTETLDGIHDRLAAHVPDPSEVSIEFDPKLVDKKTGKFKIGWNTTNFARWFLFEYLELPVIERGKRKENGDAGDPSMKEAVLMELQDKHPVAKLLLERIEWNKFQIAFFTPYSTQIDGNNRIHSTFKPWGTVTGRLSSGKEDQEKITAKQQLRGVNLQQIPRNKLVRGIFGAAPGWYFIEADYSQIELRIAAALAGERTMLGLYARGEDIHMAMAMRMTGKPAHLVTKEERKRAKAVNFGFLYGMGWRKFIETAWLNYGVRVTEEESKAFRKAFFEQFQGLLPWHAKQRRLAQKFKRVETPMGRVRHLPDIDSPDQGVAAEAERQAINSPVQGMASDMALLSLVHTSRKFREWGVDAYPVGAVHDAVNFEVRADQAHLVLPVIKDTMENLPLEELFGVSLPVPIVADIKAGRHWGGATEIDADLVSGDREELRIWLRENVPSGYEVKVPA